MRANDRRLRQQGPTHGYGPNGKYGRIGQPAWGGGQYVALIVAIAAGIMAVLLVILMVLRG
jgi:hypothetical protein